MSAGRNQYAVYRLRGTPDDLQIFRNRSYQFWAEHDRKPTTEIYEQICISQMEPPLAPAELRRQLENGLPAPVGNGRLEVSDVLVIMTDGITTAYYVDPDMLIVLTGFFYMPCSAVMLTIDTVDYQIDGRPGSWMAADEMWIDGQHYFLMRSQKFGNEAKFAVLDSRGRKAAEDTAEGFSEDVIRQIREHAQRQALRQIQAAEQTGMPACARPALENWQKSYENGEYLRSAEMAEEQNYSMIDGRMNNMAPKILPPGIPERKRQKRKRRSGKLPLKDRESVLKRLKEYQEELGRRGGQTVPGQEAPELQERRNTP